MYIFTEVFFYSGQRKYLPTNGYRPELYLTKPKFVWGITFVELPAEKYDVLVFAII